MVRCVVALGAMSMLSGCLAAIPLAAAASGVAGNTALITGSRKGVKNSLPMQTAKAIGQNLDPATITVSDVKIKFSRATWTADTPLGRYSCGGDDQGRDAYCYKQT